MVGVANAIQTNNDSQLLVTFEHRQIGYSVYQVFYLGEGNRNQVRSSYFSISLSPRLRQGALRGREVPAVRTCYPGVLQQCRVRPISTGGAAAHHQRRPQPEPQRHL